MTSPELLKQFQRQELAKLEKSLESELRLKLALIDAGACGVQVGQLMSRLIQIRMMMMEEP